MHIITNKVIQVNFGRSHSPILENLLLGLIAYYNQIISLPLPVISDIVCVNGYLKAATIALQTLGDSDNAKRMRDANIALQDDWQNFEYTLLSLIQSLQTQ